MGTEELQLKPERLVAHPDHRSCCPDVADDEDVACYKSDSMARQPEVHCGGERGMEISCASSSATDVTAGGGGGGSGGRQVKLIPVRHPDPDLSSFSSSSLPIKGCLAELRQRTLLQWVELLFPSSRWIRTYKWRECLQSDLMAGVTVGTMLVPQVCSPLHCCLLTVFLVIGTWWSGLLTFYVSGSVYHVECFLSSFQRAGFCSVVKFMLWNFELFVLELNAFVAIRKQPRLELIDCYNTKQFLQRGFGILSKIVAGK